MDAGVQADSEEGGWGEFNLGRALRLLHARDTFVVRRTLRRLHIRFWHCPAKRLEELLTKAGAPDAAIALVKEIVETCRSCRLWTRPGPRSITSSTRLALAFNEIVQWDILYHRDVMISHLLDEAIRFTAASVLVSKNSADIITAITTDWLRHYGPMRLLIADQERGLLSDESAQWMDRWQIQVRSKEPGAHAQMVERHHDIFRRLLLRVESQLAEEGVMGIPLPMIVAECALAKNLLLSVGGSSPYQGLYGRMPPIMAEFEPLSDTQLDDVSAGIPGVSRHHHRLREITVQSMVDLTAKQRIERAMRAKTRGTVESEMFENGDLVEFHRPPMSKDDSGWRGPATVVSVDGGTVTVRWQERFMQVRKQDIRRALVLYSMLSAQSGEWARTSPTQTLMAFADAQQGAVVRLGWLQQEGWHRAEANRLHSEVVAALLHVAACGLHLIGCVGGRVGRGVAVLEGVAEVDASFLWWWRAESPRQSWYLETTGTARLKLTQVFGVEQYRDMSFVQFLLADAESVNHLRLREPEVPNIGGPFDPEFRMPMVAPKPKAAKPRPEDGDAPEETMPPPDPPDMPMPPPRQSAPSAPDPGARSRRQERSRSPDRPPGDPAPPDEDEASEPAQPRNRSRSPADQAARRAQRDKEGSWAKQREAKRAASASREVSAAKRSKGAAEADDRNGGGEPASSSGQAGPSRPTLPLVEPETDAESQQGSEPEDSDATEEYEDSFGAQFQDDEHDEPLATVELLDGFMHLCTAPDAVHYAGSDPSYYEVRSVDADQPVEFYVTGYLKRWMDWPFTEVERRLLEEERSYAVVRCYPSGKQEVLIEKEMNVLTLEEARANRVEVQRAMVDELRRWQVLGAFRRQPRQGARNVLDSRWVLKWKMIDGRRQVRARLTVRGYRDVQAPDLKTFAATTSRWGQRVVSAWAAQNRWTLFSCDVSQAFLRGLPFSEIAKMKGEVQRDVQFVVPPGSLPLLRQLEGYEDFDGLTEVLGMIRAGFGLKDAPRAWNMVLTKTLTEFGLKAAKTDPQVFMKHLRGTLVLVVSTHVDDLKGAGEDEQRKALILHLERCFGKLKVELGSFDHVGVSHVQNADTKEVHMHQHAYVAQLRPIPVDDVMFADLDSPVTSAMASSYMTLLGAAAWLTLTCPAICVYVSYLQRHSKAPACKHVRDLNRLVKWLKKTPQGVRYRRLEPPLRLVVVSDSSFSAGDTEGLVMRGCLVLLTNGDGKTTPGGETMLLDWYSRKQPHVCRSTFAAELHAVLDGVNQGIVIQGLLTELAQGAMSAEQLCDIQSSGQLAFSLHACIDAKSVFDAITADKIATPNDKHLLIHCLKMREFADRGLIAALWWVDTVDMLADGLTKGVIDRRALLSLAEYGVWTLVGQAPARWPKP